MAWKWMSRRGLVPLSLAGSMLRRVDLASDVITARPGRQQCDDHAVIGRWFKNRLYEHCPPYFNHGG